MSCFDSVYITCPTCRARIEFQSKAGKCYCENYDESRVPTCIADDIDGDVSLCHNCVANVVASQIIPVKTIAMHGVLKENYEESDYEE